MAETQSAPEPASSEGRPTPAPRRAAGGALRRMMRSGLRILLLTVGPLLILTVGGYYWATSGRVENTENAYVKAEHVLISPDIDGRVVEVAVRDNQLVHIDDPLFKIDPWPYQLVVDELDAKLAATAAQVAAYRAAYRQARAELDVVRSDAEYLEREFKRRQSLAERNILPKAELDDFRHQWQLGRQRVVAIEEKMVQTLASLGGDPELQAERHPTYKELLARRNQAALDLARTEVRAPTQGVVTNVDLQVGEYVTKGKPVFSLLATTGLWIEANLKETQLTHVRVGQAVAIEVDAYPSRTWEGRVASLSPGTGAEFSLLPPQNATGNWVKVVQRVPVRIEVLHDPDAPQLRAGMSALVKIDTGYERPLPSLVQSALALVGYSK